MARELDDIMQWVANEESFYNTIMGMYDDWVDDGDAWDEGRAEQQAQAAIEDIAEQLESMEMFEGLKYTDKEKRSAVAEVMSDFEEYRDAELADRLKKAAAKAAPRKPMDEGDKEYSQKMESLLTKIGVTQLPDVLDHPVNMTAEDSKKAGIEMLLGYMPVSAAKIRHALETGDEHLNTIKLRKWDEMAEKFGYKRFNSRRLGLNLSLSDAVGVLKHVAKWYYA